jgi:hypothetical protein
VTGLEKEEFQVMVFSIIWKLMSLEEDNTHFGA